MINNKHCDIERGVILIFPPEQKPLVKIPKESLDAVNRRRTDNALAKRKGIKNDLLNITRKTKNTATRTSLKTGYGVMCSGSVDSSCYICGTRRVTRVTIPGDKS